MELHMAPAEMPMRLQSRQWRWRIRGGTDAVHFDCDFRPDETSQLTVWVERKAAGESQNLIAVSVPWSIAASVAAELVFLGVNWLHRTGHRRVVGRWRARAFVRSVEQAYARLVREHRLAS
jgi:hypothetical protein